MNSVAFACLAPFAIAAALCASCRSEPGAQQAPAVAPATRPAAATTKTTTKPFAAVPDQHALHNGYIVTEKVISGAQPEGEESFRALRELGVKTIISVDGAKPDIETARRYGIAYIHLPIGYNDVAPETGRAIAKAINEKPGPIYIHCHHGRHRSAAAVAVACVYNGQLRPEQAEDVLRTFGAGANYKGLWKAAREARPVDPQELKEMNVTFVEQAKISATADAMVHVDHRWDHLKQIQTAGWKAPPEHPDLEPPHEALLLAELMHELQRVESKHSKVPEFQKMLAESEAGAKAIRDALLFSPPNIPAAEVAFKAVGNACAACHKAYRD